MVLDEGRVIEDDGVDQLRRSKQHDEKEEIQRERNIRFRGMTDSCEGFVLIRPVV
jgi:hypothetical protein